MINIRQIPGIAAFSSYKMSTFAVGQTNAIAVRQLEKAFKKKYHRWVVQRNKHNCRRGDLAFLAVTVGRTVAVK